MLNYTITNQTFFLYNLQTILFVFCVFLSSYLFISSNPFYSLVAMISIFLAMFPLLIALQFDFIAVVLIIVYVGAVSVLFLFVIMTINLSKLNLNFTFKNLPDVGTRFFVVFYVSYLFLIYHLLILLNKAHFEKKGANEVVLPASTDLYKRDEVLLTDFLNQVELENDALGLSFLVNSKRIGIELYQNFGFHIILFGLLLLIVLIGIIEVYNKKG